MEDPDLELRGGGPGLDLLALSDIFPSVISSFFTKNKGGSPPQQQNNNTLLHIPITWFVRNVLNN